MTEGIKYTRQDAITIINLFYNTRYTIQQIKREVGCSTGFIKRVVRRENFADVHRPSDLPEWRHI